MAQTVKHLPTVWETQVQSLNREDLLEKGMATHSSILASHQQKGAQRNIYLGASLVDQRIMHLPVMWKTKFRSSGLEDPLGK